MSTITRQMNWKHFRAISYRKILVVKRTLPTFLVSCFLTLFFSGLAILMDFLMKTLISEQGDPVTFKSFVRQTGHIYAIPTASDSSIQVQRLKDMYYNDTGNELNVTLFPNRTVMNQYMYECRVNESSDCPRFVMMGIEFLEGYNYINFYNGTYEEALNATFFHAADESIKENPTYYSDIMVTRLAWKKSKGDDKDFKFSDTRLIKKTMDLVFGMFGPLIITCGLATVIPPVIAQPISDLTTDVRKYLQSCGLTLFPYWLSTFLIDLVYWIVISSLTFLLFVVFRIKAVTDNLLTVWYSLTMAGPSLILFTYNCAFLFRSTESGARNTFVACIICLVFPLIGDIVKKKENPMWLEWVYTILPHINCERLMVAAMTRVSYLKQPFGDYWKDKHVLPQLIMQFVSTLIYLLLLWINEIYLKYSERSQTVKSFDGYRDLFDTIKKKQMRTQEAIKLESTVPHNDYIIKVQDVSRLFFDSEGKPVAAVNHVSLGVKEGQVYGLLGANGAGKTTLIKMITGMLPPSDGTLEIKGKLSVCPQFNSHLFPEMTPSEHIWFYKLLYNIESSGDFEQQLELDEFKDKTVGELSGGQRRRLAVAVSMMAPCEVVLLDEPTSSLDPYARRLVHKAIQRERGKRTFILCTHLLGEAEMLCDEISIFVKGGIYTVGSPQYLSARFGKELKIEVIIEPGREREVDDFMREEVSGSRLEIKRRGARVYAVDGRKLREVMEDMEKGRDQGKGFKYFTVSMSSLERVFMEIVRMSEEEGEFVT